MATWTTGSCEANGINIHYLRTGGDKPAVILLHGLMTNGACWSSLAQALEQDCDVIMPDSRGHGCSSAPLEDYSYDTLARDVLGLIVALGLSSAVLIGHSMGGMTAAVAASRSPKQVRGLVLAEPTFLSPQRQIEVYESDVAAQHRRILNGTKEDFLTEMRMRYSHRVSDLIELLVQARFQTSMHAFEVLRPPNPDYRELIKTLRMPGLLVMGDVGAVVSAEVVLELSQLNQCLEIVQIAEAGHGLPYDQPERFSCVVKNFLRLRFKSISP